MSGINSLVGLLMMVTALFDEPARYPYSIHNKQSEGVAALFLLAQAEGIRVTELDSSIDSLRCLTQPLVSFEPAMPFDGSEVRRLLKWVAEGGRAGIFATRDPGIGSHLGLTFARQESERHVLLQPQSRLPYVAGVGAVVARDIAILEGTPTVPRYLKDKPFAFDTLLTFEGRPVALRLTLGDGVIIVAGCPDVVSNKLIASVDNAIFAANVLKRLASHDKLMFDEYHRRLPGSETVMDYMALHSLHWVWAQLLIFVGILIWTFIKPFGRQRAQDTRSPLRDVSEYAEAAARLYQKAAYRDHTTDWLVEDLRRRMCSHQRLPRDSSWEQVEKHLTMLGRTQPEASQLLNDVDRLRRMDSRNLTAVGRKAFEIRRKIDEWTVCESTTASA